MMTTIASNIDRSAIPEREDKHMSLRDDLAGVLARDSRYSIHSYIFVFDAIQYTKKLRARAQSRVKARRRNASRHVTGKQLCEGACALALAQYGLLAKVVLHQWGIRTTSDLGEIVYNLIASGDLEKTDDDSRTEFDNVFDFEVALRRDYVMALDEVA
jgi:uncharacterized repeat protein (TIGR04138 family)